MHSEKLLSALYIGHIWAVPDAARRENGMAEPDRRRAPQTLEDMLADMPPCEPSAPIGPEPTDFVGRARYWARITAAEAPGQDIRPEDTLWWALADEIERLQRLLDNQ